MAEVTRRLNVVVAGDAKSVEAAMRKTEQAVKGAADQAERSGKEMGDSFDGVEKKASKLGDKLKGFAASLGAGLGLGGGFAIGEQLGGAILGGFSQALDKGAQVKLSSARLGLSDTDAKLMGSIAGKLYGNAFVDDYASATKAIESVVSTLTDDGGIQWEAEAVERLSEKAAVFAKVMEQDVSRSVNSVGILMKSGLADNADEAFDLITAAMSRMPAHMRDELLEASDEYSQFFAALGIQGEHAFGLLAAASAEGMYGIDKTGDAIKEFTIRATDLSTSTQAAYDTIGVGMEDMTGRLLAGGETARGAFDEIVRGLLSVEDPGRRAEAAIALFGTPLEDLGVNDIPQFLSSLTDMSYSLQDVAGSTDELGKALDTPGAKIEKFKRQAMDKLADGFAKVIPLFENFGNVVSKVGGFVANNKEYFIAMGVAVGVVLAPAILGLAIKFGILAANMLIAAAPFIAIGLVIAGVAAGVVWLYKNVEIFRTAIDAVAGFITGTVWPALQGLAGIVMDVVGVAINIVVGYFNLWWEALKTGWGIAMTFKDKAIEVFGAVKDRVVGVVSGITDKFGELVQWFKDLPGRIADALSGIKDKIGDIFHAAFERIKNAWNNLVGGKGFTVPSWIPGLGGKEFRIPMFHGGGVFNTAAPGGEGLALLRNNEVIFTPEQAKALGAGLTGHGGGSAPVVINVTVDARGAIGLDGSAAERGIAQVVTRAIEHRLIPGLT